MSGGGVALGIVILTGTFGYWLISDTGVSLFTCLFMTVITITTIGYSEVIDFSGNNAGRLFTIIIAFSGIGVLTYTLSYIAAFIIEGEILKTYRKKRITKMICKMSDHYLVCGVGEIGLYIADELTATKRNFVLVDMQDMNAVLPERYKELPFIQGDAADESILLKAGVKCAKGVFAVTGDDNCNLVITVAAKQVNPGVRVATKIHHINNIEKTKRVGADAVVSPTSIGALRLTSEMVRPTVVSFLDVMLRDSQANLRVEEVGVPSSYSGKPISALNLHQYRDALLVALRDKENWVFNPRQDSILHEGSTLIFMITPEVLKALKKHLSIGT